MSCASCRRRPRRTFIPDSLPRYPVAPDMLSAPTLTPDGWQCTCTKCGVKSEPKPFKEQITAACACVPNGETNA